MRILKRSLSEEQVSAVIRGVLTPLVYIHADKVLLTPGGQVKLGDLGVTSQLEDVLPQTGPRLRFPYWTPRTSHLIWSQQQPGHLVTRHDRP
jgi:hypothetical protein